jgi:hypothetical protein
MKPAQVIAVLALLAVACPLNAQVVGAHKTALKDLMRGEAVNFPILVSNSSAPVMMLGEVHADSAFRLWVSGELKASRAAGFTVLALEYPATEKDAFARFNAGADNIDEIRAFIERYWEELYHPASVLTLIKSARDAGMAVVPVDMGLNEEDRSVSARDDRMAANMWALLESGAGRVLFYGGMNHGLKTNVPRVLAQRYGIASVTFCSDFEGIATRAIAQIFQPNR